MLSVDSILEKIKQQCTAVWLDRTIWKDPKQSWGLKMMRTSLQIWWASGQACIALKMSLRADHDLANAATQSATDGCSMVIARGSHLRYSNITCDWFKNYGWIYIYIYYVYVCVYQTFSCLCCFRACIIWHMVHPVLHTHTNVQTFFNTRSLFARVLSSRQIVFQMELYS